MARDNTVTYVKALGIILMVLGHVLSSDMLVRRAILTFHMPLFFLMSGYCFKEKYLDDAKQFVMRKIKGIYMPYVLFALPFLALHNVFCHWHLYESTWLYGWKDFAWNAGRIVTRMSMNEGLLGTFWFLKELFWGNLIFYATVKLVKWQLDIGKWRLGAEWLTVIELFVLTEIVCIFHLRVPYFGVGQTSLYAAFFIGVGYLWKKSEWNTNRWWIWVIGITSVFAEASLIKGTVAIDAQTPMSLIYYAVTAIFGTMVMFNISKWLNLCLHGSMQSAMLFIGEHTLSIMALHFISFKIVTLGCITVNQLPIERLEDFPVIRNFAITGCGVLLYMFVGLSVPLVLAWLWCKIKERINVKIIK